MDFQDTMPVGADAPTPRPAPHPADRPAPAPEPGVPDAAPRGLAIEFTGSGSEYFRIWIVNLLLTVVTLGLYLPFAKARRLRYFHGNTLVGGHALAFHGNPWKMLRGFLLMAAFAAAYVLAGQFSPVAGAIAVVAFALMWPALWQASLRFRLANTSWRGLRLRFGGSIGGAYAALLPLLLPAALLVAAGAFNQPEEDAPRALDGAAQLAFAVLGLAMLLFLPMIPWLLARLKRYQHGHYQFAGETTRLEAKTRSFYGLYLRTFLVSLLPIALFGIAAAMLVPMLRGRADGAAAFGSMALVVTALGLGYLGMLLLTHSYFTARLQDLVWGGTRSARLRFSSHLPVLKLLGLHVKNLLLTLLTLGLYRPFAAVAMARLRLQAVALESQGDVEQWSAGPGGRVHDATGDAAADLLGWDIGL